MNDGIIEVRFGDGPLAGSVHRMVGIGEHLVAWEHLDAKGIVQVSTPDRPDRQANLWRRHDYQRSSHGENWADYALATQLREPAGEGDES